MKFLNNNLELHDSYFIEMKFESIKDFNDRISIILESDNFMNTYETRRIMLVLEDCFKIVLNLNMWVSGKDTVKDYNISNSSDWLNTELENCKIKPKETQHFKLELNTSGSIFNFLISKEITILPVMELEG